MWIAKIYLVIFDCNFVVFLRYSECISTPGRLKSQPAHGGNRKKTHIIFTWVHNIKTQTHKKYCNVVILIILIRPNTQAPQLEGVSI
jgi:hypothetical protein